MKVSVVTRTINRPSLETVKELIQNQTYNNIEHIIVSGFDRFNAAAEGFKKVTGDIVLLLDDDDYIDLDHVENAVKHFTSDVFYVNTGFKTKMIFKKTGKEVEKIEGKEFIPGKTVMFTHSSCFFFRSELLKQFDYLDSKYNCPCEDAAFYSDIAMNYKGVFTGAYSSKYILHQENTSGLPQGIYWDETASARCISTIKKIIKFHHEA